MASGVFGLKKVYKKQYQNITDKNFASWPESGTYGYYGGGIIPTPARVSTIDRLDFSTETVTTPSPTLPPVRSSLSATSSSSYGYFGGGYDSPTNTSSTINRLDFSTETVTTPAPKLSQAKINSAAISSSSYGYFGGGYFVPTAGAHYSTIDRIDFSTETVTTPSPKLSESKSQLTAVSNSSYGYFAGGFQFNAPAIPAFIYYSTIDRIDFSTETRATPSFKLSQVKSGLSATSSSSYGYFGGGYVSTLTSIVSTIDRLDFSNETVATPSPKLSQQKQYSSGTSSSSYGYFGGGSTPVAISTIDRLDFSTETVTTPTPKLSQAKTAFTATSGGQSILRGNKTYGYWAGGRIYSSSFANSTINRLDFSTETVTTPIPRLPQQKYEFGSSSTNFYGYFGGGLIFPVGAVSNIDRLDFSNETIASTLTFNSLGNKSTSSSSYGYFSTNPNGNTTINRLDFLTETVTTPTSILSTQRGRVGSTSSSSYGYFGGGYFPAVPLFSTITRLDFSTETVTTPSPTLSYAHHSGTATSSSFYGYFGGGYGSPTTFRFSTISRLDFITENTIQLASTLSSEKPHVSATSSSSYGYFGSGRVVLPGVPGTSCAIDRLDFSTETRTTIPAVLDSVAGKGQSGALSNSN